MRRSGTVAALCTVTLTALTALAAPTPAEAAGTIVGAGDPNAIPGQYIVVLNSMTPSGVAAEAGSLTSTYGGTAGDIYTSAVEGFSLSATAAQATQIAGDAAVAYVEQDETDQASGTQTNPPWNLDRVDQRALPLDSLYTYPNTGSSVTAYVVDTGIRTSHTEFGGRAANGFNAFTQGTDSIDCNGHGTHVAGTIGGSTYGVAKQVQLVAVKVLDCSGRGTITTFLDGVDWVDKNAVRPAVVNMSLGFGVRLPVVDAAVTAMVQHGLPCVVAAGNDGVDANTSSPGGATGAIVVGATDSTDTQASFSNFGPRVDIYAPGVGVTSAYWTSDTATATLSGTSMAAPHVAGAAAMILADHPGDSPADIKAALLADATTGVLHGLGAGSPNSLLYVPPPGQGGARARAMIVGDSISQGSAGDFTWRYRLYKQEIAAGVNLDLLGPRTDLFDNVANTWNDNHTYIDPNFDQQHDAIWGRTLLDAAANIGGEITANGNPDYLLVLLGINDLGFGFSDAAGTEASLKTFIANARAAKPDERFIFGKLLPTARAQSDSAFAAMVADYNNRLVADAAALSTAQSPIFVADDGADIVPATDLWDGTHPNARGEVRIAAGFVDALANDFGIGVPFPRPYPDVPLGPQTHPLLSIQPGDGQATLSWTTAPGATGYFVYQRDVTAGDSGFTKLPYPVPGSSWTAGLLINGHQYQYYLGTTKGNTEGVFSNTVTVTPSGPVPGGVTDLSAVPGDGQATLNWTPAAHANSYLVFMKNVTRNDPGFTQLPFPVPGSSWTAGLLINGDQYQFQLQSMNGTEAGGLSNIATVTPVGITPGGVTDLHITAGDGQATLQWTPVAHATGYYVLQKNVSAGETAFTKLPYPVTGSSWTASALVNGATYQYRLQSANGDQLGGLSNIAQVVPNGPVPVKVSDLSATSGDEQATLHWTAVAHATGYFVYIKNVGAGEANFTKLPYAVAGSPWTAGLLVNGDQYQFEVQPVNGLEAGPLSNIATVTPLGPTPARVSVTATPGDGQATLSWTLAANATGYYVYQKNVSAGDTNFTQLPYPVPGPTWTATLLENGATYQYQLQSVNGAQRGGFSNIVTVTPMAPTPAAVTDLAAASGDGQATLTWSAAAHATGYYVYVKNVSAGDTDFTQLPYPVTSSPWTAGLLENGATYQFQLQSINGLQRGGMSNIASVVPLAPTPAAVTDLAAASGDGQARLTWSAAAHATGYFVYEKNVSDGDTSFTQLPYPVTGTSWTAGLLENGATYQFKLQSINGLQRGGMSNIASVVPLAPTPAGVTDLAATAGNGQVSLQWSPAAHATAYYVSYRNVWAGQTAWTTDPIPIIGTSFTQLGLNNGYRYEFQLQSSNGLQMGNLSNIASATPYNPPGQGRGGPAGCTQNGICITTSVGGDGSYIFTVAGGVAVAGGVVDNHTWCGHVGVTATLAGRTLISDQSANILCGNSLAPVVWTDNVNSQFPSGTQVCVWGYKTSGDYNAGGPACIGIG